MDDSPLPRGHGERQRKVGYAVSQELVKVSSLLPANKNRSYLVHSLVKALGLLDPSSESSTNHPSDASTNNANGSQSTFRVIRPRPATVQELCAYHDRDYIDFVLSSSHDSDGDGSGDTVDVGDASRERSASASEFGIEDDCPPFPGLGSYVRLIAGATLAASEALKNGEVDVAICWDGGRHHAQKSRAAGFCYVADCILAILSLKRAPPLPNPFILPIQSEPESQASHSHSDSNPETASSAGLDPSSIGLIRNSIAGSEPEARSRSNRRKKSRIMYLDLDLHFSDGISTCFYNSSSSSSTNIPSQVLTFSVHYAAPGFYPAHPLSSLPSPSSPEFDPFTLSLPLKQGASAKTFARIWKIIEDVREAFDPDYVIVQCGTDGLAGDPHAIWNWSCNTAPTTSGGGGGADGEIGDEEEEREEQQRGTMDWCVGRVVNNWGVKVLLLGGGGYNSPNTARAWTSLTSVVLGRALSPDTPIPSSDHPAFPLYAPSFTLEVPPGHMRDENTEEYFRKVESVYGEVTRRLRERCTSVG